MRLSHDGALEQVSVLTALCVWYVMAFLRRPSRARNPSRLQPNIKRCKWRVTRVFRWCWVRRRPVLPPRVPRQIELVFAED